MRIDTQLAERLKKINPSATLAITAKAKKLKMQGRDVVTLAAGEPDFDTPQYIKDAAISAIQSGFTKYTPTTGTPELKEKICQKFLKDNGLEYSSEQIVVSCGAKHSIFNALFSIIDEKDEVLIPSPYWVSYPEMVNLCGGIPRFIKTSPKNDFKISTDDLKKHIHTKTKAIIINSPSNPTGSIYEKDELQALVEMCVHKKIYIISDEIYEKIIFDGLKHTSVASLSKRAYEHTITVNGLSKSHSMTGWRIGYLGAPLEIAKAISKIQDHSTSNPSSISQKAAFAALSGSDEFSSMMSAEFQKRRDYIIGRLNNIPKIDFILPKGAFYIFCDISKSGIDSMAFATRLLDEAEVAVIPGVAFGQDNFIRLSFAASHAQIEKGMDRIEKWLNGL
ncbi:MAG: pyridoxal phosphate-dependent aminotransferase [Candidatus Omnitrophota bacterium]|jgi:aspartate aminotransferase|nr:MAG: pyridoxal phosphate-dependent aminotransferase [Candidatus Omnitrophota bacterium]